MFLLSIDEYTFLLFKLPDYDNLININTVYFCMKISI